MSSDSFSKRDSKHAADAMPLTMSAAMPASLLRLATCLLVAVTLSALAVAYASFQSRQLFIELQALQDQHTRQQVRLGQLLLEESVWSSLAIIEQKASDQLGMQVPDASSIIVTDTIVTDSTVTDKEQQLAMRERLQ